MLIGTYEHNLDGKNRVFIPAKFREELGETFYYTFYGSEYPSIQLYSEQGFKDLAEEFKRAKGTAAERDAKAKRLLAAGEASYDNQGRVVFSPLATKRAGIEKQCVFVGFFDYVEVMSPETYEKYLGAITLDSTLDEQASADEKKVYREYKASGKLLGLDDKE